MMHRLGSTWVWLALGVAVAALPWRPSVGGGDRPIVALIFPGPAAGELETLGVLPRLRASHHPWTGADLALIPGATADNLWRRLETGMVAPPDKLPSLLRWRGIAVLGEWQGTADVAVDQSNLAGAEARLADPQLASSGTVVVLNCVRQQGAWDDPRCRAAVQRGITLLEKAATDDGVGLLLSVPAQGSPHLGAVWATSRFLKPSPWFRFREIDFAPSMLYLCGYPLPAKLDGVPGLDLFSGDFMFHRPVHFLGRDG